MALDPLAAYRNKLYKSGFRSTGVDTSISPSSTGGSSSGSVSPSVSGLRGISNAPSLLQGGGGGDTGFGDPAAGRGQDSVASNTNSGQDRDSAGGVDKSAGKEGDDDGFSVAGVVGAGFGIAASLATGNPELTPNAAKFGYEAGETIGNFFGGDDPETETAKQGLEAEVASNKTESKDAVDNDTASTGFGDPAGGSSDSAPSGSSTDAPGSSGGPGPGFGGQNAGLGGGADNNGGGPGSGDNSGGPNGGPGSGAFWEGGLVTDNDPNTNRIEEKFAKISEGEYVLPIDVTNQIGVQNLEMIRQGKVPASVIGAAIQQHMGKPKPGYAGPGLRGMSGG